MTARHLAVVSAGLNQPSATRLLADRLAEASADALRDRGVEPELTVIELRDHAHDLTNNLLTLFATEKLQAAKDSVAHADGVIAVTPVISASYSGLFKTFFDLVDEDALTDTPVLLGASGGTARHSLTLEHTMRPLFVYLRALVVPTAVFAASEDWGSGGEMEGGLVARVERAGGQLAELVATRERRAPADPFDDPTPFEHLLGAHRQ